MINDMDELEFPTTPLRAHAEMTRMAADIIEEDDLPVALDVIDEVRAQLVDILLERRAKEEGSGMYVIPRTVNRPQGALLRSDMEDPRLDNDLDFTK